MKKFNLLIVAALALLTIFACENNNNTETVKAEIKETAGKIESSFNRESSALENKLEAANDKVDEKIKELKIKWSTATGEAKTKLEHQIDDLQYHQENLVNNLKHIDDKVESGWTEFKTSAQESLQKVDDDLEKINKSL